MVLIHAITPPNNNYTFVFFVLLVSDVKPNPTKEQAHYSNVCAQQQRLARIDAMCERYYGHAAKPQLIDNMTDAEVKRLGKREGGVHSIRCAVLGHAPIYYYTVRLLLLLHIQIVFLDFDISMLYDALT